jgi:hypothetical protein
MRVVHEKPYPDYKLTIYQWNNKFILKYESGMYEQTYKISELDLTGTEDIVKIAESEPFVSSVKEKFLQMHHALHQALSGI